MAEYKQWINSVFIDLNIDADVFVPYVIGILEDGEIQNDQEIEECIAEILSSTMVCHVIIRYLLIIIKIITGF